MTEERYGPYLISQSGIFVIALWIGVKHFLRMRVTSEPAHRKCHGDLTDREASISAGIADGDALRSGVNGERVRLLEYMASTDMGGGTWERCVRCVGFCPRLMEEFKKPRADALERSKDDSKLRKLSEGNAQYFQFERNVGGTSRNGGRGKQSMQPVQT